MSRRKALKNLKLSELLQQHPNPGLWLDKFPACLDHQSPEDFNQIFRDMESFKVTPLYQAAYKRRTAALAESGALLGMAKPLSSRLCVGLGNESVLETSISLDYTYGVPIIPGSAIKGVAASFAARELEGWEREGEAFRTLFGASDKSGTQLAGCVTFHDAWPDPSNPHLFSQDVINVHHPDYYQSDSISVDKVPADWDDPTPVGFLTTSGTFLVAVSGTSPEWTQAAYEILQLAFEDYGVGGKTSRGYGRLQLEGQKATSRASTPGSGIEKLLADLAAVQPKDKPQFSQRFVDKWKNEKDQAARKKLAQAIATKLKELKWDKDWADKAWYKEIIDSLSE